MTLALIGSMDIFDDSLIFEEDDNFIYARIKLEKKGRMKNIPKIEGYVEKIVPSLSAMEFKKNFR